MPQSCLTLCNPMDCSLPGSSVHGILQASILAWVKVKVKVSQLCPTLCDPMDYTVHGILQARILEWVAFPFSSGSSQPRDQTQVSRAAGRVYAVWATSKVRICIDHIKLFFHLLIQSFKKYLEFISFPPPPLNFNCFGSEKLFIY